MDHASTRARQSLIARGKLSRLTYSRDLVGKCRNPPDGPEGALEASSWITCVRTPMNCLRATQVSSTQELVDTNEMGCIASAVRRSRQKAERGVAGVNPYDPEFSEF